MAEIVGTILFGDSEDLEECGALNNKSSSVTSPGGKTELKECAPYSLRPRRTNQAQPKRGFHRHKIRFFQKMRMILQSLETRDGETFARVITAIRDCYAVCLKKKDFGQERAVNRLRGKIRRAIPKDLWISLRSECNRQLGAIIETAKVESHEALQVKCARFSYTALILLLGMRTIQHSAYEHVHRVIALSSSDQRLTRRPDLASFWYNTLATSINVERVANIPNVASMTIGEIYIRVTNLLARLS